MQECKLDLTHIIAIIMYLGFVLFFNLKQILSPVFLCPSKYPRLQVSKVFAPLDSSLTKLFYTLLAPIAIFKCVCVTHGYAAFRSLGYIN